MKVLTPFGDSQECSHSLVKALPVHLMRPVCCICDITHKEDLHPAAGQLSMWLEFGSNLFESNSTIEESVVSRYHIYLVDREGSKSTETPLAIVHKTPPTEDELDGCCEPQKYRARIEAQMPHGYDYLAVLVVTDDGRELPRGRSVEVEDMKATHVNVNMTIKNVDFQRLAARSVLYANFKQTVESVLATQAGVPRSQVNAVLSAGSVLVDARIRPVVRQALPVKAAGDFFHFLNRLLDANVPSLIGETIAALDGIDDVTTGMISVQNLVLKVQELTTTSTTTTGIGTSSTTTTMSTMSTMTMSTMSTMSAMEEVTTMSTMNTNIGTSSTAAVASRAASTTISSSAGAIPAPALDTAASSTHSTGIVIAAVVPWCLCFITLVCIVLYCKRKYIIKGLFKLAGMQLDDEGAIEDAKEPRLSFPTPLDDARLAEGTAAEAQLAALEAAGCVATESLPSTLQTCPWQPASQLRLEAARYIATESLRPAHQTCPWLPISQFRPPKAMASNLQCPEGEAYEDGFEI